MMEFVDNNFLTLNTNSLPEYRKALARMMKISNIVDNNLYQTSVKESKIVYLNSSWFKLSRENNKKLFKIIEDYGFIQTESEVNFRNGNNSSMFISARGEVLVVHSTRSRMKHSFASSFVFGEEFPKKLFAFVKESEIIEEEKGSVHVLTSTPAGLDSFQLGTDYSPLIEENYSQEVVNAYRRTVEEFNKPVSAGNISIFSGPPGTGKTYLIRAFTGDIKKAMFLLMDASLIASATGPELISVLKRFTNNGRKLVLILEDADSVLAPRHQTDMRGISSLLNLADGIVGKLLNVRIIATTNSPAKSLDKAITRSMRICEHAIVDGIPRERAKVIYNREGGTLFEDKFFGFDRLKLCDIYYYAKNPEKRPERVRKVGF